MTSAIGLALFLALLSAVALNWGYFAQHAEAAVSERLALRSPGRSLRLLFSNRRWLAGFLVGIGGWVLYVGALALGPLSLVQAASAGGIGILALLAHRFGGVRLGRGDWGGVGLATGGLGLLGISLAGSRPSASGVAASASVAAWMAASMLLALLTIAVLSRVLAAGAGLGLAAGLLYAAGDVGTKAVVGGGARLAFVPAVLAAHGLAFVFLQLGFQRGGVLATAGVATLVTNAAPIAAGMTIFGDALPTGALGVARVLAFAAVVAGAVVLTRPPRRRAVEPAAALAPSP